MNILGVGKKPKLNYKHLDRNEWSPHLERAKRDLAKAREILAEAKSDDRRGLVSLYIRQVELRVNNIEGSMNEK